MRTFAAFVLSLFLLAVGTPAVAGLAGDKPEKPVKEKDKSKPIRRGLEEWYARNSEAFRNKDLTAVMALRTDDFQTTTPEGQVRTRADMEAYTVRLFGMIDHFETLEFEIGTIQLEGDVASADVTQRTVRTQCLPDGRLHQMEARAVQTERWKMTADGWKLYRVDHVRDRGILVDGKLYQPGR